MVPKGELLQFLTLSAYPQNILGSKIAQMTKEGINSGKQLLIMQVSILIHNHPPESTPGDLHQNFARNLGLLYPSFCMGLGRNLLG